MEINVCCRKEGEAWIIEDPGSAFVTEYSVAWKFEGLEPGIVPLLAFENNRPFGPFDNARFADSVIRADLQELPASRVSHPCTLLLVQWTPAGSKIVAAREHQLTLEAPEKVSIKVYWEGPGLEPRVEPETCPVGGKVQVDWQFENVPDEIFTTLDFQEWWANGPPEPRPLGPFAELHGSRTDGRYRLTGWTDCRKASYRYAVSFYDRKTGELLTNHDPQLDNNGVPPGQEEGG